MPRNRFLFPAGQGTRFGSSRRIGTRPFYFRRRLRILERRHGNHISQDISPYRGSQSRFCESLLQSQLQQTDAPMWHCPIPLRQLQSVLVVHRDFYLLHADGTLILVASLRQTKTDEVDSDCEVPGCETKSAPAIVLNHWCLQQNSIEFGLNHIPRLCSCTQHAQPYVGDSMHAGVQIITHIHRLNRRPPGCNSTGSGASALTL